MRGVFFYTACIAFLSGVFVCSFFDVSFSGIVLLIFLSIIHGSLWYRMKDKTNQHTFLICMSVGLLMFGLGAGRLQYEAQQVSPLSEHVGKEVSLYGHIAREPDIRETLIHVYIAPSEPGLDDEYVLVTLDRLKYLEHHFSYDDRVRIEGTLTLPEAFETDGGRIFDYPGYLKTRDVTYLIPYGEAYIESSTKTFLGTLYGFKTSFLKTLEHSIPEPYVGLGEGVLLGVKRALDPNLEEIFRNTGIIHIVVLSGYNIMIVVECLLIILSFFFFPRTRMILGCAGIWIFALLVGLSATVVRASLMAMFLLIARATGRTYAVLRALMCTAVIMVIHNPYILVHDPGFQLSFLATLGLIIFMPWIELRLTRIPQAFGIRGVLAATIAAQVFVLPLLLYQTGLFSVVSIVVNVLVLPMIPFAMFLTFITGIIGTISSGLGIAFGFFAYVSLGYIIMIATFFNTLPFVSVSIPTFPFWVVVMSYGGISLFLMHILTRAELTKDEEVLNEYEAWTIVEEKETLPESQSDSGSVQTPLPFR